MEEIKPTKFTPRCYAFIQNEEGAVLVLRELWSGVHLNKLPGGGQEVGEGMHECLNREIEEEFSSFSGPLHWTHVYTPTHAFVSRFRPEEQLILNYFKAHETVAADHWVLKTDENLLQMLWLPAAEESASWFTLDNDRTAFLAFLKTLHQ
jgi:8-oxo-dGTP diphosphatase